MEETKPQINSMNPPENHQTFYPVVEETKPQTNTIDPPPENHQTTTKSKVIAHAFLTGSAKLGTHGPGLGHVDIGESENAFFFRVSVPGLERVGNQIRCEIQREGRVCVEGVVPDRALTSEQQCLIRAQVFQFCPPGPFSIVFNLPGQVDPRLFKAVVRAGILEAVVIKLGGSIPAS